MTSPMILDLLDRLRTLAEALEELLVTDAPDGRAPWARTVGDALRCLGAASDATAGVGRLVGHLDAALAALRSASDAATTPQEVRSAIVEACAFGATVRARALDVAAVVGEVPAEVPVPPLRASVGKAGVVSGIELPAPDILPRDSEFDPEADVRRALAVSTVGVETVRRWLAAGDEEDDANLDDVELADPRGSTAEIAHLRRIARDALEDIAVLGALRRPEPELPWDFAEHFEERLLANLDALVSLDRPRLPGGPVLGVARQLWDYASEWQVPDPGRAFAFAFVLACVDRPAGPRWVGVTLRRAGHRLARSLEDAIALGSSAEWPGVLAGLLQSETDPERLRVVLAGWHRHGRVDPVAILPLVAHGDPAVARAAIACLSREPSDVAVAALHELLAADPVVAAEAALALARLGDASGLRHLRAVLAEPGGDHAFEAARVVAARAVALLGDPREGDVLRAVCSVHRDLAELLGWHGQPSHGATLLALLREGGTDVERRAAAWGLTRLLGWPAGAARGAGPVEDALVWQRALPALEGAGRKRVQLGQPVAGRDGTVRLVEELRGGATVQRDRPNLLLELELTVGRPFPLDLEGWIATQREVLGAPSRGSPMNARAPA